MIRTPVVSSNIESIGYDGDTSVLEIAFLTGAIYQYFQVPVNIWVALMGASSHGSAFSRLVRDRYTYAKVA